MSLDVETRENADTTPSLLRALSRYTRGVSSGVLHHGLQVVLLVVPQGDVLTLRPSRPGHVEAEHRDACGPKRGRAACQSRGSQHLFEASSKREWSLQSLDRNRHVLKVLKDRAPLLKVKVRRELTAVCSTKIYPQTIWPCAK